MKMICTLGTNLQVVHACVSKAGSSVGSKGSSGVSGEVDLMLNPQ